MLSHKEPSHLHVIVYTINRAKNRLQGALLCIIFHGHVLCLAWWFLQEKDISLVMLCMLYVVMIVTDFVRKWIMAYYEMIMFLMRHF